MRYQGWAYVGDAFLWILFGASPLLPGLIIREFFDALTGDARLQWSPWALLALVGGVGLARCVNLLLARVTKTQQRFMVSGLLRRNVLALTFAKPGAEALHSGTENVSPGELVSYLRDDG
jgi:ATP-binding cassette subfamily B protein